MKRFVSLFAALTLLLAGTTACSSGDEGTDTAATTTTMGTTTTTQSVQELFDYNAFTGEYDLEKGSSNRPIGIMVPNDSKVIGYQPGIDKADFYMECETEGAIPRLLTVFAGVDRIPEKYGPLRSARSPFITTARALGVVYVHAGGSVYAKQTLSSGVLDHFDALTDSTTFWRDSALKSALDTEHSLVTGGSQLAAKLEKSSYSSTIQKTVPFSFGAKSGSITANKVQLNTTPSHRATFVYNSETGLYGKNIGTMDSCKAHKSLEGNQIQVSNILVLYGQKFVETTYSNGTVLYDFKTGTGSGYLISGGTAREIKFTRGADSLTIQETDGSTATFAEGKIYMVLADDDLASKIIFA